MFEQDVIGSPISGTNRVVRFNASGTWTVPPGVFFIWVKMKGAGPGASDSSTPIPGGATSVSAGGVTITAPGGTGGALGGAVGGVDGPANSGDGPAWRVSTTYAWMSSDRSSGAGYSGGSGGQVAMGRWQGYNVRSGLAVTPGSTVTITLGAGGDGTRDGGTGYVDIEYEV